MRKTIYVYQVMAQVFYDDIGVWGVYDSFEKAKDAMFEAVKKYNNLHMDNTFFIKQMKMNDTWRKVMWALTTVEELLTIPREELEKEKEYHRKGK